MLDRKFAIDLAGFGVRLSYLEASGTKFKHSMRVGYMEDYFLRDVTGDRDDDPYADLEPLGDGATRVLAWHLTWRDFPDTANGEHGYRPKNWHVVHTLRQPAAVTCRMDPESAQI